MCCDGTCLLRRTTGTSTVAESCKRPGRCWRYWPRVRSAQVVGRALFVSNLQYVCNTLPVPATNIPSPSPPSTHPPSPHSPAPLCALGRFNSESVRRGVAHLMAAQDEAGDWPQEGILGVFNRACGITYTVSSREGSWSG